MKESQVKENKYATKYIQKMVEEGNLYVYTYIQTADKNKAKVNKNKTHFCRSKEAPQIQAKVFRNNSLEIDPS